MTTIKSGKKKLSAEQREELLGAMKARFEKNMSRHEGLEWARIRARMEASAEALWSLNEMERTGGEPDVVGHDQKTGEYVIHVVNDALAQQMNETSRDLPYGIDEFDHVGLSKAASDRIVPPRIAEAPVAFECTLWETLETASRQIFIGQVRWLHAREGLIDTETWRVRLQDYFPVARFGASFYVTTRERFSIEGSAERAASATTAIDEI